MIPGFVDSHAHLVFAGDRSAEFAARMSRRAVRRRRHRDDGGGDPAAPTTASCSRDARAAGRELLRAGHDDFRDQERLRADRRRRGALAADRRGVTDGDDVPRRARRPRRVPRPPRRLRRPGRAGRCWRPARHTPGGSTCSATRRVRRGRGADDPAGGRDGRAAACGCTPTSSAPGPASQLAVELGAASRRPLHVLPTTATSTRSPRLSHGRHAAARRRILHPLAVSRTRGGCSTRASTVALATDCNPGSSYTTSMPFCIALAVREMRMTPAEALWAATAGGAPALRRDDVGVLAPGRGRTSSGWTRRRTSAPRLPARRAARRATSCRPAPSYEESARPDDESNRGRSASARSPSPTSSPSPATGPRWPSPRGAGRDRRRAGSASRTTRRRRRRPSYGVSTGFGALATRHIPARAARTAAAQPDPLARRRVRAPRSSARSSAR